MRFTSRALFVITRWREGNSDETLERGKRIATSRGKGAEPLLQNRTEQQFERASEGQ